MEGSFRRHFLPKAGVVFRKYTRLGIREAVDRVVPMQRDAGGLSHGQVLEPVDHQLSGCPLSARRY
jgi:hypothetical protein